MYELKSQICSLVVRAAMFNCTSTNTFLICFRRLTFGDQVRGVIVHISQ